MFRFLCCLFFLFFISPPGADARLATLHLGQVHSLQGVPYNKESEANIHEIIESQLSNFRRLVELSRSHSLFVFHEGQYVDLDPRVNYPPEQAELDTRLFMAFKDFQFSFDRGLLSEGHLQLLYEHGAARIALALEIVPRLLAGESEVLNQQISLYRDLLLRQMQAEGFNSARELRRRMRADPQARALIMDNRERHLLSLATDLSSLLTRVPSHSAKPPLAVFYLGAAHRFTMAPDFKSLLFTQENSNFEKDASLLKCTRFLN